MRSIVPYCKYQNIPRLFIDGIYSAMSNALLKNHSMNKSTAPYGRRAFVHNSPSPTTISSTIKLMETNAQKLLPEHIPFDRKRIFWGVVLFLTALYIHIYTYAYLGVEYILYSTVFLPMILFDQLIQFGEGSYTATIILYTTLIYFSLFRSKINFYVLGILIILILVSFYSMLNFINSPFT